MPIINATIRWADNTEQLRQRLKEGIGTIDAMKAAVEKTVQSLGGQGLLRAANQVTAAILEMGGTQRLTAAEQQRANTLLEKAIEKYRVLGQVAPEAMIQLARETRAATTATVGLVDGMSSFGRATAESARASNTLIAGLTTAGRASLAKPILEAADASKQMTAGMSAIGSKAAESGAMIAGMGQAGKQALAGIATSATSAINPISAILGVARTLAPALGVAFSATTIVNFAKQALASADALQKMSDRTGIGVEGLQRLQVVGDDTGNTIEQLTGAINQMQNRLAGGDASALAALTRLGLSFEEIRRLSPDQQFMAIGDALRGVKDPADQVSIAMDLFGRQGAEILPSIKRGFDDVRDASVGMSAETVKALDDAGDAIDAWARRTKGALATALAAWIDFDQRRRDAMTPDIAPVPEGATRLTPLEQATIRLPPGKTAADYADETRAALLRLAQADINAQAIIERQLTRTTDERKRATDEQERAAKKIRDEQAAAVAKMQEFAFATRDTQKAMADLGRIGVQQAGMITDGLGDALLKMQAFTAVDLSRVKFDLGAFFEMGKVPTPSMADFAPIAKTLRATFADAFTALPSLLIKSFTGGGNLKGAFHALGAQLGASLFSVDLIDQQSGKLIAAGSKIGNAIAKILPQAFASAIPGIGALIGPALSALWGGLKKLFGGPSEAELKGRSESAAFQDLIAKTLTAQQRAEAGGEQWKMTMIGVRDAFLATGRSAEDAERSVRDLFDTKNPEAYKRAMQEIQGVMDEQKQDQADLQAAIERYGFTFDQLGPALQRQKLGEQARQILNDFRLLSGAGIDFNVVLDKMGTSINDFIQSAIRTGTEVPSAMRPILQHMIGQRELLDENGRAFESLEETGLTFSETMTQGFDRVVNALNRVLVGLGLIPEALAEIPTERRINVRVDYDDPGFRPDLPDEPRPLQPEFASRGGRVTALGIQPFSHGGIVQRLRPQYLQTGGLAGMSSLFPTRGSDTQLAMLSVGETVRTVDQEHANTALINALAQAATNGSKQPIIVKMELNHREVGSVVLDFVANEAARSTSQGVRLKQGLGLA